MQGFLMTRGYAQQDDYIFLGRGPGSRWWERFEKYGNSERSGLVVTSDGERWFALLSGIPTKRRDVMRTPIRIKLALEGSRTDTESGAAQAVQRLIAVWLEDLATRSGRVAAAFDEAFPEQDIAGLLVENDDTTVQAVDERLQRVLAAFGKSGDTPGPSGRPAVDGWWVGSLHDEQDQDHRTAAAAAAALLAGAPGIAGYFNMLRTSEYAGQAAEALRADTGGSVHVLTDLRTHELPSPKEAPRPPKPDPRTIAAILGAGAIVIVLVWVITRWLDHD
ncbi:hypothetical protein EDD30_1059 [Couchioplanes caeruleus]|nr:hypothetical protein EDD30_1059 [Couchioplanes caeruleus]